ncbi:MFS transporter [Streptomyces sp. Je 1-369]|uniref:MFS transporter n=1 Tax=Streptomyces sp. Je 1-369 TaxID=2966192 RepID=UPI002285F84D|nr:MFS transporter [Streptomyces sp. Je 1-369]WAL99807.1 MFS transporter [Streptomyces sp. Je 1-369]
MRSVLWNRTYRRLFTAQVVALTGTGLATVALSLLAYDLAGADASAVLGTALAIKMVAYVGLAPLISAFADRVPRRALLVTMDGVRAGTALVLPFVHQVWQVYVLIFLLQAASAAFTPTFQATIPEILPAERDYLRALSLSRLAYELESLLSPVLAAALLATVTYNWLFAGTALGFLASAALVVSVALPAPRPVERDGVQARVTFGARLHWATPRLRALLALDLVAAAAGAMVIVNTVVLVREHLRLGAGEVSLALGAFGAGSMAAAVLLPRALERFGDRCVMLPAGFVLGAVLAALTTGIAHGTRSWGGLLAAWALLGAASSMVLTPSGGLIRRSAAPADLPAAFAAQFALSHGCWLLTYPLAGWLAATAGMTVAAATLTVLALAAATTAALLWPTHDPARLTHLHTALPADDPHLADAHAGPHGWRHAHDYVIDVRHPRWPTHGHAPGRAPSRAGSHERRPRPGPHRPPDVPAPSRGRPSEPERPGFGRAAPRRPPR